MNFLKKTPRHMMFLSACASAAIILAASPGHGTTIELVFKKNAVVTGEKILLGDVAEITTDTDGAEKLNKIPIAIAPDPGKSKRLNTEAVISYLNQTTTADTLNWQGPLSIKVVRDGIVIDRKQYYQILTEYIHKESARLPTTDITITFMQAPPPFTLPKERVTWEVIPAKADIISSSSFVIIFKRDGKTIKKNTVRVRLGAFANVATAATTLQKGTIISVQQLTMTRQDLSHLKNPFFNRKTLIGAKISRTIVAGQVIDKHNIELTPVINKGDQVKIAVIKGPMRISTAGIAIMSGLSGEIIKVENISSKKIINARVSGHGVVTMERW